MTKHIFVKSYGCQMNVYDSNRIIDLFQPWVYLGDMDFQSDFFDSNIIDSISVALTDYYKELTAEDPNAIFEVTSNIEEWNKGSEYNAIPKELYAFVYPFFSKEAIMNLRKEYILYKKKYVQLSEKEVYDNFMIEKINNLYGVQFKNKLLIQKNKLNI